PGEQSPVPEQIPAGVASQGQLGEAHRPAASLCRLADHLPHPAGVFLHVGHRDLGGGGGHTDKAVFHSNHPFQKVGTFKSPAPATKRWGFLHPIRPESPPARKPALWGPGWAWQALVWVWAAPASAWAAPGSAWAAPGSVWPAQAWTGPV